MHAFVIDAFDYCRLRERREGELAVSDLGRLAAELASTCGPIRWVLEGGEDRLGHLKLVLSVSASVQLICQRCLIPFSFDVESESILILAKSEGQADEIEALLDDDALDVIVGSKELNVLELIEDEILLTIPLSPKHDICPNQSDLDGLKGVAKISPFAVLKDIKQ